jgi:uncharacterized protein YjbI with pentapeptide repeats
VAGPRVIAFEPFREWAAFLPRVLPRGHCLRDADQQKVCERSQHPAAVYEEVVPLVPTEAALVRLFPQPFQVLPGQLAAFTEAIENKLKKKDFDFRGIHFPTGYDFRTVLEGTVVFAGATFEGPVAFSPVTFEGKADFSKAIFKGSADFSGAIFMGVADFEDAIFHERAFFSYFASEGHHFSTAFGEGAYFIGTTFEAEADFSEAFFDKAATFSRAFPRKSFFEGAYVEEANFGGRADFSGATFKESADFDYATFQDLSDFTGTTFKEEGKFWSLQTSPQIFLSFQGAVIKKPERFSFHSTYLRPSWFVDVDAQKFDFSDVEWFRLPNGEELTLEKEIEALEAQDHKRPSSLRKLQKACRQLMNNAEENRDYPTANEFHYWSMELARKEAMVVAREEGLREGLKRFGLIDALYGALSGYGERPRRAFLVLAGMGTLFAIFYVLVAGSIEHVGQAFLYSLAAMVRLTGVPAMAPLTKPLQPSEPGLFQFLVTAEGILGPLQIALLALAVRRKVMR